MYGNDGSKPCLLYALFNNRVGSTDWQSELLIAGFNTMSEKVQAKWDMEAVSKFLGRVLLRATVYES